MKKLIALLLAAVMCTAVAGCAGNDGGSGDKPSSSGSELALITDLGTIDDKSFNQGSWEGLKKYADEFNKSHRYFQPQEQSDDAYLSSISQAVEAGAKLIVTPGFLFETPIYKAQSIHPSIKFVLVDGTPNDGNWGSGPDFRIDSNTVSVMYAEEQSGFLAGYAAVKDGYRKLGFMGGMAVPAVVAFGIGYVQGADYAAGELGLSAGDITVNYHYTGHFNATPEVMTMAASWYNSGVDVIFACGGAVGNSVMAAAESAGKKVIGVDVDQSGESVTVITSAMKGLTASVYAIIKDYYDGRFPGGQTRVFNAANDGVGLPQDFSRFNTFNKADYDAIYAKLVSGSINVIRDDGNQLNVANIPSSLVSVTVIN